MQKLIRAIKVNRYQFITFLVAFVPRVVCTFYSDLIRTISDEVATISAGAYFAGLDWSAVISKAGYYGGGFSALYSIFFRVIDNPYIIYHCILITCCLVQAITSLISYSIIDSFFDIRNKKVISLISIASSYMVVTRANVAYNEHILILISWLAAWILLKLHKFSDNKRVRAKYTMCLMICFSYALTVHTRAITYWLALLIIVLIYFAFYRKWIVSIPTCVWVGGIGYGLSKLFTSYLKNQIWLAGSAGELRNSSISTSGIQNLLDPQYWQGWASIILGQLNTISLITGGMIIVAFCLWIQMLWHRIKNLKSISYRTDLNEQVFLIMSFFFLCCGITIGGQSITWLPGLKQAMEMGFGSSDYSWKAVTYIRYFGPYCGPLLMVILVYSVRSAEHFISVYKRSFIFVGAIAAYWLVCILPYVYDNSNVFEAYLPFSIQNQSSLMMGHKYFIIAIIILLSISIVIFIGYKKNIYIPLIILGCYLIYHYSYNAVNYDAAVSGNNHAAMSEAYSVIKQLQNKIELPEEIYVADKDGKTDHQNYYYYQFLLNRYTIKAGMPDTDVENAIVIRNNIVDCEKYVEFEGYMTSQIGEKEYLFVKGNELQQDIINEGIDLKPFLAYSDKIELTSMSSNNNVSTDADAFISDGSYNFLTFGPYMTLEKGTYRITFSTSLIENSSENVFSVDITKNSGKDCLNHMEITKEMAEASNGQIEIEISLSERTSGLEFRILTYENTILQVNNIVCEKISDNYIIGLDNFSVLDNINSIMKSIPGMRNVFVLKDSGQGREVQYLEKYLDKTQVTCLSVDQILDNNEFACVLVRKNNSHWFDLLQRYTIFLDAGEYVLLIPSAIVNDDMTVLSFGDQVNFSLWLKDAGDGYVEGQYSCLPVGRYIVQVNLEDKPELYSENIYVDTIVDGGIKNTQTFDYNQSLNLELEITEKYNVLQFNVYTSNGTLVNYYPQCIEKLDGSTEEVCRDSLYPLLELVGKVSSREQILQIYNDTLFENAGVNFLSEIMSEAGIKAEILKSNFDGISEAKNDFIIIPDEMELLVELLDDYIVVGRNERNLLLAKNNAENLERLNNSDIYIYSSGRILQSRYFFENGKGASQNISIPSGSYKYLAKLDILGTYKEDISVDIKISCDVGNVGQKTIVLTEEDYLNGYIDVEIPVSCRTAMNNITVQTNIPQNEKMQLLFRGVEYITEDYELPLALCNLSGKIQMVDDNIHCISEEEVTVQRNIGHLNPGRYDIECYYVGQSTENVTLSLTSRGNIVQTTSGNNAIEDHDVNKLTVTYTVQTGIDNATVEFSSSGDASMIIRKIILKQVEVE